MVERELQFAQAVLWPSNTFYCMCMSICIHAHINNKYRHTINESKKKNKAAHFVPSFMVNTTQQPAYLIRP